MTLARRIKRKKPGSEGRKIILFGDSHSYAVQRAVEKRKGKDRPVPLSAYRLSKTKNGKRVGDTSFEELLAKAAALGPDDVVLSMIGGNQHAIFSLIQHPQPYDFFEPRRPPDAGEGAEIIPYRILAAVFEDGIRNGDGKSLQALRSATQARLVHILPPPPKSDNAFLKEHHEARFAREGITSQGVSSPSLRLKFWRLQRTVLEALCAELDIEVMPPPARTLDKKGFLAPAFYAKDATHANHVYGEFVLREVENRFAATADITAAS